MDRRARFPIGASVTLDQLRERPYEPLAALRAAEPVSFVPALNAWFITRRDLAVEAMRDDLRFTVDDPRFSTATVLGDSMLNKDGAEHERHRSPFAPAFRPLILRDKFGDFVAAQARALTEAFTDGTAELRTELAGPLAVNTITEFLGLQGVTATEVLGWYRHITAAITGVTLGEGIGADDQGAIDEIHRRVIQSLASSDDSLLHAIRDRGLLPAAEIAPAAVVIMFGAIETAEGMTTNAFWHLLSHPAARAEVQADRSLLPNAIDESLRLEPAAAVIDRYTTSDVEIGGVTIPKGELVTISLLAANRDPAFFDDPDRFDIHRENARQHVTFVQGPHACLGVHLTRMETLAALETVLDRFPELRLNTDDTDQPDGLIFRKPNRVMVHLG